MEKFPTRVLKIHECLASVHQHLFKRSHVFGVSGIGLSLCRYFESPKANWGFCKTLKKCYTWQKCPTRVQQIRECLSSVYQQSFKRSHVFCVFGTKLSLCRYFEFPKTNWGFCKLWSSESYGQITWKVCKKYMNAFHLCMRNYSRGAIFCVCLELDCVGVEILFLSLVLPQFVDVIHWQHKW
jgi:hypothetical protein